MQETTPEKESNIDERFYLTSVADVLHTPNMLTDVKKHAAFEAMKTTLLLDAQRVAELTEKMLDLADAHLKFVSFEREAKERETSAKNLIALLGPDGFKAAAKPSSAEDHTDLIKRELEPLPTPEELRARIPLWECVRQYLRFVPEAQVGEILEFFALVNLPTSRQAVESAMRTHPTVFSVKKKGREKFISLK